MLTFCGKRVQNSAWKCCVIPGLFDGLSSVWHQAITWTNADYYQLNFLKKNSVKPEFVSRNDVCKIVTLLSGRNVLA